MTLSARECATSRFVLRAPLLLVLLLVSSAPAFAQQPEVKPPTLLKQVDPIFPASMQDAGVGATVVMEIDIGTDGKVMEVKVVQSAGADFDAAAVDAAKQLEFTAAEMGGKAIPVRIQYSSNFVVQQQVVEVPQEIDAGIPVVNFSGTLLTAGTREPIVAATVLAAGQQAESNNDGKFEFFDLPVGPLEVKITAPGHEAFTESEEIKPGERTEVRYVLRSTTAPARMRASIPAIYALPPHAASTPHGVRRRSSVYLPAHRGLRPPVRVRDWIRRRTK